MKKQDFIDWALRRGWKLDKWGHLQKEINSKQYRFKISKHSIRYEVKSSSGWLRLRSGYFKDLRIDKEDKLAGLK